MENRIEIPEPPAGVPPKVQQQWKKTYEESFREAQNEYPDDIITQKQAALREANKLLRTPALTSYDQAMGLESWHFVLREPSDDGKELRIVTRHGKAHRFPIPENKQKADPPKPAA